MFYRKLSADMEDGFYADFLRYDYIVIAKAHMVTHDEDEVHDIVMDIMLYAYSRYESGKYVRKGSFAAWLSRVAYRYIISKHCRRRVYCSPLREAGNLVCHEDDLTAFEDKLSYMEYLIDRLPYSRKVLIGLHLEGKTIDEISVITGTKRSTTGDRLKKTKRLLKEQMVRAGYDNPYKDDFY